MVREMYIECAFNVSRIFVRVWCAITIGAGGIGAPLVLADYKYDDRVRCPLCLLTCQSHNNLSVRGGNGNSRRQRQSLKAN
jgi:hypothetical protein